MRDPRWPLPGCDARVVETLIGLAPNSLRAVERRANGDVALIFRQQILGDRYRSRRVLRIPRRRLLGYVQRSPHARERDVRARRRANSRRFAWWLDARLSLEAPVIRSALWRRDLEPIEELRAAILRLAGPDYYVVTAVREGLRRRTPDTFPESWLEEAS
jgi:hypothetical protein